MKVGLKFMLEGGQWSGVVLEEAEAKAIVERWVQGTLPEIVGSTANPTGAWGVRTKAVIACHTFPLDDQGNPPRQPVQPGRFVPGTSGLN